MRHSSSKTQPVVAAGHQVTAAIAGEVLAEGGNAVDACIAAAFAAFVVEPVLAGPLGGAFLMHSPKTGPSRLMDAFVQTPRRALPEAEADIRGIEVDFGPVTQTFHIGAGTTAAPCLAQGLFEAHARLGHMPLRTLVEPACRIAREGHALSPFQAHVMSLVAPILGASQAARAIYFQDEKLKAAGDTLQNPALADMMETLAIEGPRLVSEGEVGQALIACEGNHLSVEDMRRARPIWRDVLVLERADTRIELNPPPSLGGIQIALGLDALPARPDVSTVVQCLAEIDRLRRETGLDHDPQDARNLMLDDALVQRLRKVLAAHQAATRGTTHISVIDAQGDGAALTLSNGEGNGILLPGTGIMPNNMLGEDDLVPDGPLSWTPDTRLASMMCPMALRGRGGALTMLGSGGSNRIRSALLQASIRLIDFGMSLEDAVNYPRVHFEKDSLDFEGFGSDSIRETLLGGWPEATIWPEPSMFFGGVHAVRSGPRGSDAAGDPRRSGAVWP